MISSPEQAEAQIKQPNPWNYDLSQMPAELNQALAAVNGLLNPNSSWEVRGFNAVDNGSVHTRDLLYRAENAPQSGGFMGFGKNIDLRRALNVTEEEITQRGDNPNSGWYISLKSRAIGPFAANRVNGVMVSRNIHLGGNRVISDPKEIAIQIQLNS